MYLHRKHLPARLLALLVTMFLLIAWAATPQVSGAGLGSLAQAPAQSQDNGLPSLSIADVSVAEGNSGQTTALLTISLSAASAQPVSVLYQTANGSAVAPGDYTALAPASLIFAPGQLQRTVAVAVTGDLLVEPDEAFTVQLSSPTGATLGRGAATITIRNDDQVRYALYIPIAARAVPPPPPPPPGWVTLLSEGFEGEFPGAWQLSDRWADGLEYLWSQRACRAASGGHSGWAVGGGANGAALPCASSYPNDAESWMVYGPFSLADVAAADLQFKLWLNSELGYDGLCRLASVDGENFHGFCTSGNSGGWADKTLDLTNVPDLGNLAGSPNVWVAIAFSSDSSIGRLEGGYVDDIVLRTYTPPAGAVAPPRPTTSEPTGSDDLVETPAHRVLGP